ncbi:MAG TPA: helix-turn-helix transcriptional regulator, partial [Solirubrobacter sp.]|nr:helix-turn-helix transcriptional regulator [Solirubrobacter sp.]
MADPRSEALGARIRTARESAGLSVRGLARRIGVSPSLLSQVERGLAQPSVGTLWALVTELSFSLDGLFASAERPPAGDHSPAPDARAPRGGAEPALDARAPRGGAVPALDERAPRGGAEP